MIPVEVIRAAAPHWLGMRYAERDYSRAIERGAPAVHSDDLMRAREKHCKAMFAALGQGPESAPGEGYSSSELEQALGFSDMVPTAGELLSRLAALP